MFMLSVNVKTVGEPDNLLISIPKAKEVKGQSGSSTLTKHSVVVFVGSIFHIFESKSISKV